MCNGNMGQIVHTIYVKQSKYDWEDEYIRLDATVEVYSYDY